MRAAFLVEHKNTPGPGLILNWISSYKNQWMIGLFDVYAHFKHTPSFYLTSIYHKVNLIRLIITFAWGKHAQTPGEARCLAVSCHATLTLIHLIVLHAYSLTQLRVAGGWILFHLTMGKVHSGG